MACMIILFDANYKSVLPTYNTRLNEKAVVAASASTDEQVIAAAVTIQTAKNTQPNRDLRYDQ